ncbi:hypothetical protein HYFRA_00003093 [Hymenoscyphus fraxineus]|uniref:Uncharacterized protein n=1 Tax=Hymenoscyphus fraxineus TaxID=746836 RepID=A0A9N9KPC9_9HELO|nr:hypothetical protein HYFRA_00003093 [Hymenoscyphus fraxineus]
MAFLCSGPCVRSDLPSSFLSTTAFEAEDRSTIDPWCSDTFVGLLKDAATNVQVIKTFQFYHLNVLRVVVVSKVELQFKHIALEEKFSGYHIHFAAHPTTANQARKLGITISSCSLSPERVVPSCKLSMSSYSPGLIFDAGIVVRIFCTISQEKKGIQIVSACKDRRCNKSLICTVSISIYGPTTPYLIATSLQSASYGQ